MVQHMQNIDKTAAAFYAPREASDSIGPVGYIGPGGSERLKGFIDIRVDSAEKVRSAIRITQYGKQMIENDECVRCEFGEASRLSIRLVVNNKYIDCSRAGIWDRANVEATLPMHGRNHNDSIAYIGFNSSTRSPSAEESRTYSRRMGEVMVQAEDHAEMQRRLGDRLGEVRRKDTK